MFTVFFPIALHKMHFWTIYPQAHISAWILQIVGYSAKVWHYVNNCMSLMDINNSGIVCIGTGCSGVELFLIFAVFILLFKGRSNNFLWFIPFGILLIAILNIFRIIALSLIVLYAPDYLDFNHKYTFTIIVYGFLIWLWMYWMNRYYDKK
jgi:exosortase family protein XrtF